MFSESKSQKLEVRILQSHIRERRLATAYIFSGEEAESSSEEIFTPKEELAAMFACALQNEKEKLFDASSSAITKKILNRTHPDVKWIGLDKTVRSIKIAEIRGIIQWATLKPYEGKWKVGIVVNAERLTEEASNAFLKTLEEPPENTIFCLLVENKNHLLETIQSRAFEIRLKPQAHKKETDSKESITLDDILESYPLMSRKELKAELHKLMLIFRNHIHQTLLKPKSLTEPIDKWLQAMGLFYDSAAALDANVNQKLMVTRLAMHLSRLFPNAQRMPS